MTEKTAHRAIKATRKNFSFGTAIIFEGRCVHAFANEDGTFLLSSGCYNKGDITVLPEFKAMMDAGTETFNSINMGGGLVKITSTMAEDQFTKYLLAADGADWELQGGDYV